MSLFGSFLFFFAPDASGIAFDRNVLEHESVVDDATVAVEDRCGTAAGSLAKAKEVLQRFYKEIMPKGAALRTLILWRMRCQRMPLRLISASRRASTLPWGWPCPWHPERSWIFTTSPPRCQRRQTA